MKRKFRVMIIEDDFRIAAINQQLVEQVDGFLVEEIAKTGQEAMSFLESAEVLPDLILLDVFIPDRNGLDLFHDIRRNFPQIDIIMLTAAAEAGTIEETVQGGIFDYILKPADFGRFELALRRYLERKELFAAKEAMGQHEIDQLLGIRYNPKTEAATGQSGLPKGIDPLTLQGIQDFLASSSPPGVTAMETGKAVGVSRSTARRYLEHLVSAGEVQAQLNYGEIGRPERRYSREQNEQKSQNAF